MIIKSCRAWKMSDYWKRTNLVITLKRLLAWTVQTSFKRMRLQIMHTEKPSKILWMELSSYKLQRMIPKGRHSGKSWDWFHQFHTYRWLDAEGKRKVSMFIHGKSFGTKQIFCLSCRWLWEMGVLLFCQTNKYLAPSQRCLILKGILQS